MLRLTSELEASETLQGLLAAHAEKLDGLFSMPIPEAIVMFSALLSYEKALDRYAALLGGMGMEQFSKEIVGLLDMHGLGAIEVRGEA
jgi:hypothetical protein